MHRWSYGTMLCTGCLLLTGIRAGAAPPVYSRQPHSLRAEVRHANQQVNRRPLQRMACDDRDTQRPVTLDVTDKVQFARVDWETNFRRAFHAPWPEIKALELSTTNPPQLLLSVDYRYRPLFLWRASVLSKFGKTERDDLRGVEFPPMPAELQHLQSNFDWWIADVDGSHARLLRNFKDCHVDQLAWSSDGSALLHRMIPDHPADPVFPASIQALRLKDQSVVSLPATYQEVAVWGADSHTLLLWRKTADSVVTHDNLTGLPRWKLFQVDNLWEKRTTRLATATVMSAPASISPDGKQLVYSALYLEQSLWHLGPQVIETLSTGHTELIRPDTHPIPPHQPEDRLYEALGYYHWSGDRHWLFANISLPWTGTDSIITDLTTHQDTDLREPLAHWRETVIGKDAARNSLAVNSFTWVGSDDTRLHVAADTLEAQALMEQYELKYMIICVAEDAHGAWRAQAEAYSPLVQSQPDRFGWCTTFDLPRFDDPKYVERVLQGLEQDFADGAIACKIWKNFGMEVRHPNGEHMLPDDPLLQPIFAYVADRNKTLLMHIAEPLECWLPLKEGSPHFGYYSKHPEWHMHGRTDMPSHSELIAARDAVAAQHPTLRVVGAHFGSLEYDVDEVAKRFDRYPNFTVDISARLTDFALQETAKVRQFCLQYQDRILWGTDLVAGAVSKMPPERQTSFLNYAAETYREYTEFFESEGDVKIGPHTVQGLGLPDAILEKIYRINAQHWYPGL